MLIVWSGKKELRILCDWTGLELVFFGLFTKKLHATRQHFQQLVSTSGLPSVENRWVFFFFSFSLPPCHRRYFSILQISLWVSLPYATNIDRMPMDILVYHFPPEWDGCMHFSLLIFASLSLWITFAKRLTARRCVFFFFPRKILTAIFHKVQISSMSLVKIINNIANITHLVDFLPHLHGDIISHSP